MSKINPLYKYGDIKYFRNLHKQRQSQMGGRPTTYNAFLSRLRSGMSLKEAIYKPCEKNMSRYNMKPNKLKNLRFRFISLFK